MNWFELSHSPKMKSIVRVWLRLLKTYFRIQIEGLENIPMKGAAIVVPNHSGFAGADAALLAHIVKRNTKRFPRILAHRAYFDMSDRLKAVAQSFGLRRAGFQTGLQVLKGGQLLILFPEGEAGNFKSSLHRYRLKKFHTGFVRMALEADVPIIPCVIIGAEEANLNLGNLDLSKWIKGLRIPFPVNFIPLPSKWKIIFLPAQKLNPDQSFVKNAKKLQSQLQRRINREVKKRPFIYMRRIKPIKLSDQ